MALLGASLSSVVNHLLPLTLAHYQGGWPSSCRPLLHDMLINVPAYRPILPVCSLSSLCQDTAGEAGEGLE